MCYVLVAFAGLFKLRTMKLLLNHCNKNNNGKGFRMNHLRKCNGVKSCELVTYYEEATDDYTGETTLKVFDGVLLCAIEVKFWRIELKFSAN